MRRVLTTAFVAIGSTACALALTVAPPLPVDPVPLLAPLLFAVRAGLGDDQRPGTTLAVWGARRKSKSTPWSAWVTVCRNSPR